MVYKFLLIHVFWAAIVISTPLISLAQESEQSVRTKLDSFAQKHVRNAAMHVMPSIKEKKIRQEGSTFIASYVGIDPTKVYAELRKSGTGYVGIIKYEEQLFECHGPSKAVALSAPCTMVRTRRMTEMVPYDMKKKAWLR